jgi:hypothetical protein
MAKWLDTPAWESLTPRQKSLLCDVTGNGGPLTLGSPNAGLRDNIARLTGLGMISAVTEGSRVTLTELEPPETPEKPQLFFDGASYGGKSLASYLNGQYVPEEFGGTVTGRMTKDGRFKVRLPKPLKARESVTGYAAPDGSLQIQDEKITLPPLATPPAKKIKAVVTKVVFAVPMNYTTGPEFDTWAEAVDYARDTIERFVYPNQTVRPDAPDYDPRRTFQDGDDLISYTRAFVQMRVTEPIQDRGEGRQSSGTDGVAMSWEIFQDGTVTGDAL